MKTALIYFVDGSVVRVNHENSLSTNLQLFNEGISTGKPFIWVKGHDGENIFINLATVTVVKTVT